MQVILLERIEKLGQMGDVVSVKPGYARNYLLPQRKARRANEANIAEFEARRAQLEADNLQRRQEAEAVGEKMVGLSVILIRQASEAGQLYGSANSRDIAKAVTEAGFTINASQIRIDRPIKSLGLSDVFVQLHPEVQVSVQVNVARSEDEAQLQLERGGLVTADALEAEEIAAEEAAAAEAAAAEAAAAEAEAEESADAEEAAE